MNQQLSKIHFNQLELPETVRRGVLEAGFEYCTAIQALSLPHALDGKDVAGQAQTGTGKTAAYLLALFTYLLRQPPPSKRRATQPRAIVLAPTRELAIQIHKDACQLGRHVAHRSVLVYGGIDYEKQRSQLREGLDLLIGTPGRIIDYYKQRVFDLRAVQVMVLDEADRMFDLGFIKDIRYLLRRMPKPDKRLSMLFSATLSYRVMELAYEHMNNPELVKVDAQAILAQGIDEQIYCPANTEKVPLLLGLLRTQRPEKALVFVNTKNAADVLTAYLKADGYKVGLLSGDVPQQKRQRLLAHFKSGETNILVATDVASRGLHIPEVSHVINFDLPQLAEDYVHRVGRTARMGATGHAISFACEDYAYHLPEIEEFIGHKIPACTFEADLLVRGIAPHDHSKDGPEMKRSRKHSRRRGSGMKSRPSKNRTE